MDKSYGFVHEQQFAIQDDWNEEAMYQKQYRVAMEHDEPLEGNTKGETQAMIAPCGEKILTLS